MTVFEIIQGAIMTGGMGGLILTIVYKGGYIKSELQNLNNKVSEVVENQKICEKNRCQAEGELHSRITSNSERISRIEGRHNGAKG